VASWQNFVRQENKSVPNRAGHDRATLPRPTALPTKADPRPTVTPLTSFKAKIAQGSSLASEGAGAHCYRGTSPSVTIEHQAGERVRCAMTDREYSDYSDGIWDDGEWISWDWINSQIQQQELRAHYPHANPCVLAIFQNLVGSAMAYKATTGSYLQIWGELGELYAQIKYGLKRHRAHACGSDGKIGNDYVEVKTISP
jgi:hypothetical protein